MLEDLPLGQTGLGFLWEHGFHWGWKEHCTSQMMEVVELDLRTILKELLLGFDHCASQLHLGATEDFWSLEEDANVDCSGVLGA